MIAYTIAAALNSNLFEQVIVSTDSPLIGNIAEWYGAKYLPRPTHLATDNAALADVVLNVLDNLSAKGDKFDALCQLMPNCPLRVNSDIIEHYSLFESRNSNFQISVVPYRGVYPH